jgi:signal peptidase
VRQDQRHIFQLPLVAQNFLMLESTSIAPRSSENAERSALVAEALRRSGDLPGRVRLRVYGLSMLPALWPGDVVEIESCSLENVLPGEIVLAQRDGRLFLHRFLAPCPPHGFLLCGDSMPASDPRYPREALLGRLVGRVDQGSGVSARLLRPGFHAKWSRALGMVFCHCAVARRLALKLHSHGKPSAREFAPTKDGVDVGAV